MGFGTCPTKGSWRVGVLPGTMVEAFRLLSGHARSQAVEVCGLGVLREGGCVCVWVVCGGDLSDHPTLLALAAGRDIISFPAPRNKSQSINLQSKWKEETCEDHGQREAVRMEGRAKKRGGG